MNDADSNLTADSQLRLSPVGQQRFPGFAPHSPSGVDFSEYTQKPSKKRPRSSIGTGDNQKPRKKRTKSIGTGDSIGGVTKPRNWKKPDPTAPKITEPCTECGKKFWSLKALFGHMRCHPERQWRGINPPSNLRRPATSSEDHVFNLEARLTAEDQEAATCLLILASGSLTATTTTTATTNTTTSTPDHEISECNPNIDLGLGFSGLNCRFECSSCNRVFPSHQALGGHRASHKNVKGCFANTRNIGEEDDHRCGGECDDRNGEGTSSGHKCSICLRVFSSGQALGGHKRCHWEKDDEILAAKHGLNSCVLDLNMPPPIDDCSSSSGVDLDLRLGI